MKMSLADFESYLATRRKGATFATFVAETEPDMNKTGNPFFVNGENIVRHLAERNVVMGGSYENAVNAERVRESAPVDDDGFLPWFNAESLWRGKGKHLDGQLGRFVAEHTESHKHYLVYILRTDKEGEVISTLQERYFDARTGEVIDKTRLLPFLKVKQPSRKQDVGPGENQVKREVFPRTLKMENLRSIKIDGQLIEIG